MSDPVGRRRIRVTGVVQGVGFRPFVHGLATGLGLTGFVGNDADGVFLEAQGPASALAELERRIWQEAPSLAVVDAVQVEVLDPVRDGLVEPVPMAVDGAGPDGRAGSAFRIVASGSGAGVTSIPPDTAVCDACLAEMRDPADRRHGYPFIACTHCGPRFTITTGLPYDRQNTTMVGFPLCPPCLAEYTDPRSRRFHAQPTACAACGPRLSMPVVEVVAALRAGSVVAVKGVGGYHLACDARDAAAVSRLRARKQRGDKPFALMAADLRRGPPRGPRRRPRRGAAHLTGETDRDPPRARRRPGCRRGPRHRDPGGDAPLRPPAPSAVRRRRPRPAGDDQREPRRRADLHRPCGGRAAPGRTRGRVRASRPTHPRGLRRLRHPGRGRCAAAGAPQPGPRSDAAGPARGRPSDARRGR